MTAGPPASVTLALTPLHGPPGIPQGQEGADPHEPGGERESSCLPGLELTASLAAMQPLPALPPSILSHHPFCPSVCFRFARGNCQPKIPSAVVWGQGVCTVVGFPLSQDHSTTVGSTLSGKLDSIWHCLPENGAPPKQPGSLTEHSSGVCCTYLRGRNHENDTCLTPSVNCRCTVLHHKKSGLVFQIKSDESKCMGLNMEPS
ncbi:hypothetical protein Q5P01_006589 [Channa striata]|uniref:Uncharacterized protein n=1 Tax=Channa striata TaxID=64152 RepID=A0AA88NHK1_CHASR|nr:hypothetical protein Q5P01_006589 [Channa striata]